MASEIGLESRGGPFEEWSDVLGARAVRLLAEREAAVAALEQAVAAVPGERLVASLDDVMNALPLAVSVETAGVRLRDTDGERMLHHVSSVGLPTADLRRISIEPFTLARTRALIAMGARHSLGRALGLRWLRGIWLEHDADIVGAVFVGSRTNRRPSQDDLDVLDQAVDALAYRLASVDRSRRALRRAAAEISRTRSANQSPLPDDDRLAALRTRERAILELYADGMTTASIAELLVISPHTVRTHVKNALRRLGVHSREDAVDLVRRDRVYQLV